MQAWIFFENCFSLESPPDLKPPSILANEVGCRKHDGMPPQYVYYCLLLYIHGTKLFFVQHSLSNYNGDSVLRYDTWLVEYFTGMLPCGITIFTLTVNYDVCRFRFPEPVEQWRETTICLVIYEYKQSTLTCWINITYENTRCRCIRYLFLDPVIFHEGLFTIFN